MILAKQEHLFQPFPFPSPERKEGQCVLTKSATFQGMIVKKAAYLGMAHPESLQFISTQEEHVSIYMN